jgi:hypothetical protein
MADAERQANTATPAPDQPAVTHYSLSEVAIEALADLAPSLTGAELKVYLEITRRQIRASQAHPPHLAPPIATHGPPPAAQAGRTRSVHHGSPRSGHVASAPVLRENEN